MKSIKPTLLFNLFINDIFETLKYDSLITLDNQTLFNALKYAGDVIIISSPQEGLQKDLNALNDNYTKRKSDRSYKKTRCIIFSKGTNTTKNINITINSKGIEIVKEFKYLGITVKSRNCTFTPTRRCI